MKRPLVSVCIAAYNHDKYIAECLDSVLAQTCKDIEIVVVDDASPDATAAIISEYAMRYPAIFKIDLFSKNKGVGFASNRAIELASGKYIALIGSDDRMINTRLDEQLAYLESNPGCGAVFSKVAVIDSAGSRIASSGVEALFNQPVYNLRRQLLKGNFINAPSVMFSRDSFFLVGGFDKILHYVQDYDLWVKILSFSDMVRLDRVLTEYRVHGENLSFNSAGCSAKEREMAFEYASVQSRAVYSWNVDLIFPGLSKKDQALGMIDVARDVISKGVASFGTPLISMAPAYECMLRAVQLDYQVARFFKAELEGMLQEDYIPPVPPLVNTPQSEYAKFLQKKRLTQTELELFKTVLAGVDLPRVVLIVFDAAAADNLLVETLNSVTAQYYQNHAVWVVSPRVEPPQDSERVRWMKLPDLAARLGEVSKNDALFFVHAGDLFEPNALLLLARELVEKEGVLFYFDSDLIDSDGQLVAPQFRSKFDLYLQLDCAYLGNSFVVRGLPFFDLGLDFSLASNNTCSWWQLLVLSVFVHHGSDAFVHLPFVLHHQRNELPQDSDYSRLLREDFFRLSGRSGSLISHDGIDRFVVDDVAERILIAIEVSSDPERLISVVRSSLQGLQGLNAVIVLLDRGVPEVRAALAALIALGHAQLQVIDCAEDFDILGWMHSVGAELDWFAYVGADIDIDQSEFWPLLLSAIASSRANIVAPRILDRDGLLVGGPMVAGLQECVQSPYLGMSGQDSGYQGRAHARQQALVFDWRCWMLDRSALQATASQWQREVTLGKQMLRLQLALYESCGHSLWEPLAFARSKRHVEFCQEEVFGIVSDFKKLFAKDPFYSPNFQRHAAFVIEQNRLVGPDVLARFNLPKVLLFAADEGGCGYYRIIWPFHCMEENGFVRGGISSEHFSVSDVLAIDPDLIVVQRQLDENQLQALQRYREWADCEIVYELDDYVLNLPVKSEHRGHMPAGLASSLRQALSYCDRLIVSTERLASALAGYHPKIVVVRNKLPAAWWAHDLAKRVRGTSKPRVGWSGGISHTGDLLLIADVIAELAQEVDWVFFGHCPTVLRQYLKEFHSGVPIAEYPGQLRSLQLDLAIAPLEDNLFNQCKSNLKLLEYGACGYPVVCSNVGPYEDDAMPVVRVRNRFKDWCDAIRAVLGNEPRRTQMAAALHEVVRREWMLDRDAAEQWWSAWVGGQD